MTTQKLSAQEREAFEAFKAWLQTEYQPSWPKMTADETGLMWDAWKGSRAAMAVQPQERIDPEALILACVPGGYSCDPQAVADAIRAYFAAPQPQGDPLTKLVRLSEELGLYDGGAGVVEFDPSLGGACKPQGEPKPAADGVKTVDGGAR